MGEVFWLDWEVGICYRARLSRVYESKLGFIEIWGYAI